MKAKRLAMLGRHFALPYLKSILPGGPPLFWGCVDITNECQLRCRYCPFVKERGEHMEASTCR